MFEGNHKMDYKCIQFIRNPLKTDSFKYVALDYFDYINIENKNSIKECVSAEQKTPCEAYQTLSIFREIQRDEQNEGNKNTTSITNIEEDNTVLPF